MEFPATQVVAHAFGMPERPRAVRRRAVALRQVVDIQLLRQVEPAKGEPERAIYNRLGRSSDPRRTVGSLLNVTA